MANKQPNQATQKQGVLGVISGQLDGLIITKKGVIYFRNNSKPKNK